MIIDLLTQGSWDLGHFQKAEQTVTTEKQIGRNILVATWLDFKHQHNLQSATSERWTKIVLRRPPHSLILSVQKQNGSQY